MSSAPRSRISGARAPLNSSLSIPAAAPVRSCSHPRVQIVAREEESEFVECLECREIFEASEFRDMDIEEKIEGAIEH